MIPLHDHLQSCGIDGLVWPGLAAFSLQFGHELRQINHRTTHGATADLFCSVVSGDAKRVEAPVERFQLGGRKHLSPDAGGSAVLDVDVRAYVQLAFVTERMDCV